MYSLSSERDVSAHTQLPLAATLVVQVGYRGTDFSGFAEQPHQRTVAGELRRAFETILRRPVELTCAGRTDAGVHALAQYVSLPLYEPELEIGGNQLLRSLVALTPDDVSIRRIFRAAPGFSARFDALSRSYRYRIACGSVRPILSSGYVWWLRNAAHLDVAAMNVAASYLVGEHDFSSFCKATSADLIHADGRSTSRNVLTVQVSHRLEMDEELVVVDIEANAFLHNMVRIIVGTLVEVGRGVRSDAWVARVLAAHDRRAAGPTAPACGLTFTQVNYPKDALVSWEA